MTAAVGMPAPRKGVDPKCHDLAVAFLRHVKGATPEDMNELAEQIQETIEDFISALVSSNEEP